MAKLLKWQKKYQQPENTVNGSPNVETLHLEDADNKDTDKETDNQKIENKEAKSLRGS